MPLPDKQVLYSKNDLDMQIQELNLACLLTCFFVHENIPVTPTRYK